jgi:hypothetical protein
MYILVTITFFYFPNNKLNIKISSKKIKRSYEWHGHLIMHFYYTNKNTYLFLKKQFIYGIKNISNCMFDLKVFLFKKLFFNSLYDSEF